MAILFLVPSSEEPQYWTLQQRLFPHADRISQVVQNMEFCSAGSIMFDDQGKLQEAEKMYQQALAGFKRALGPEHMSTLNAINNLGLLYRIQGKLLGAEKMCQQALAGKEKALGPDHMLTLNTVHSLGLVYADQGRLQEAERMYQRALAGYEKALGPDHQ